MLVKGDWLHPHRPDLSRLNFYWCKDCDAYVGCHKGTEKPLGKLANKELRQWRMKAHNAFDPFWKHGNMDRSEAYLWLANELGIDVKKCHIGMFDIEQCKRTVKACKGGELEHPKFL
jgi:hypothetical protein